MITFLLSTAVGVAAGLLADTLGGTPAVCGLVGGVVIACIVVPVAERLERSRR